MLKQTFVCDPSKGGKYTSSSAGRQTAAAPVSRPLTAFSRLCRLWTNQPAPLRADLAGVVGCGIPFTTHAQGVRMPTDIAVSLLGSFLYFRKLGAFPSKESRIDPSSAPRAISRPTEVATGLA